MIQDMAQQMVGKFAAALQTQIAGNETERAAAAAEAAKPVSGFRLFFGALWRALLRLVRGGPRSAG